MPRSPLSSSNNSNDDLKKGPWSQEEDQKLIDYVEKNGHGSWQMLPKKAGLNRCGKSCRLRWTNYLRPDIKRGNFSPEEEQTIIHLHSMLGNKWATIATRLPGRTDNEIKNYWNTQLRKKLLNSGIDPKTHQPIINQENQLNLLLNLPSLFQNPNFNNPILKNQVESLTKLRLLSNILQVLNPNPVPSFLEGPLPNFSQFEGQYNGTSPDLSLQQLSSMIPPNMEHFNNTLPPNFQPNLNNFQTSPDEFRNGENDGRISSNTNTTTNSEDYSLPALVPATLEMSNQAEGGSLYGGAETPNYDELLPICNDSMANWGMDDEASSSFWKDIFTESSSL